MKKKLFRILPPLIWFSIIFVLTSIPSPTIPLNVKNADKWIHFFAYLPLGFLVIRAFTEIKLKYTFVAFSICLFAAACDELHQLGIQGRNADFLDFSADAGGAIAGILIYLMVAHLIINSSNKNSG